MNKTEFIQLIQNPEQLAASHVAALKQMVIDFPYNTHARVLLAKALFNEKHYDYDKFLKQTALAVPDRDVLYHYLHDLTPQWQIPQQQVVVTPTVTPSTPIVSTIVNDVVQVEEKVVEVKLPQEETPEGIAPEIVEPKVEEVAVTEEPKEVAAVAEIEEDVEVQQTKDELDVDLAISTLLEETQVTQPTEPIIEEPKVEEITPTKIVELVDTIEPQNVVEETVATEENEDEEELSFVEWLQRKNNSKTEIKPADKASSDVKPLEVPANTAETKTEDVAPVLQEPVEVAKPEVEKITLPTSTVEVTKEEIEQAVAKSNINDFHNILDKFIKENPSISRPKAEFFNPINMARQSVEEDEELVTETLANLYYKQGNHKKAIRAYEKLCLLYPSKMSYFASLIQKIKTEIKD